MDAGAIRALELYCGIGGASAVLAAAGAQIATAIDINLIALGVYRHNFSHPTLTKSIDALDAKRLASFQADLWWASPPCQPFTRRGRRRDLDDPRARTFLALLDKIASVRPRWLALENVVGFESSEAHDRLLSCLDRAGYRHVRQAQLCPSDFGVPNRRPRYYLLAGLHELGDLPLPTTREAPEHKGSVAEWIGDELISGADARPELYLDPKVVSRYREAIHIVDRDQPAEVTRCFTSAYGRSHVRSGSFVSGPSGPRRFSPEEILRLLGFPKTYGLPPDLPLKNAWRLVGNSLSLEPVRRVLSGELDD